MASLEAKHQGSGYRGGKISPNTRQAVQWRRCGWRDTLQQMGPFVGKKLGSLETGYEPTRVVLSPATSFSVWGPYTLLHLRRASWTMALLHVAMAAWVLLLRAGRPVGLWRRARFEDRDGESQGLRFFD